MKVLVFDDDPNAQKILRALLQRFGDEPVFATDESTALSLSLGEAPPSLIICDWKTNGINAPAFCKRVREAQPRFRPYILVLSARQAKEDLAEALDAGADDFVTKPFNLIEMQARLRVAGRTVNYQRDLQREATQAASLGERNRLLGEMLSQHNSSKVPQIMQGAAAAVSAVTRTKNASAPHEFSQYELRYILSSSLLELHLALEATKERLTPPNLKIEEFSAWAPIFMPAAAVWLDFTLSGSLADAAALFEKSLRRKPSGHTETIAFMGEIARLTSSGFLRALRVKAPDCQQPFPPRAIYLTLSGSVPPMIPKTRCHDLTIEGRCFRLIISGSACPCEEVDLAELRELDLLAEQLPPSSVSEVPLFKQGTAMSARFVEKLHEEAALTRFDYKAKVYRPSPLALHFQNA